MMTENNNPIEIAKLKAAARKAERDAELKEQRELKAIENEMKLIDSDLYAKRMQDKENVATIEAIYQAGEDLDPEFVRRPYFDYGVEANRLIALVRSVNFSRKDVKPVLIAMTGWSEADMEILLDHLGQPAYYSPKYHTKIEAIQPNIPALKEELELMAMTLGLVGSDFGKVNETAAKVLFDKAEVTADTLYLNSQEFQETGDIAYEV